MHYLLFTGIGYYPNGGWFDFHSAYDNLDSAVAVGKADPAANAADGGWWHVVDVESLKIVASKHELEVEA